MYERNNMVQLIRQFFNSFSSSAIIHGNFYDNVDPGLVRYFRNEYGRNWKEALANHLYNTKK